MELCCFHPVSSPITNVVFDVDGVLYPNSCGFEWVNVVDRIATSTQKYVEADTGERLTFEAAKKLSHEYYLRYGTAQKGLQELHGVCPDEYLAFVYDPEALPYHTLPQCASTFAFLQDLKALGYGVFALTNGSTAHGQQVIESVGLAQFFDGVRGIDANNFVPKPDPNAFINAFNAFGVAPENVLYIEDSLRHLTAARNFLNVGYTVHIDEQAEGPPRHSNIVDLWANTLSDAANYLRMRWLRPQM